MHNLEISRGNIRQILKNRRFTIRLIFFFFKHEGQETLTKAVQMKTK